MHGKLPSRLAFLLALLLSFGCAQVSLAATDTDAQVAEQASQRLNINQANQEQLTSLPGIGPAKASAIVDYRSSQGTFNNLQDLQEVRGIGPATAEKLQPLVSF
ncbi:ComEA family DNA-binding protein [Marinospirillum perlucidum]|uniref:ComEA family DNA-binding protein n=1 Tax=Marinospirillum perlucidum TaxID=1982602 RepID=UPI000DF35158|nr:ComEA family DNA-binding protein [Marinospirillum perlucidum]